MFIKKRSVDTTLDRESLVFYGVGDSFLRLRAAETYGKDQLLAMVVVERGTYLMTRELYRRRSLRIHGTQLPSTPISWSQRSFLFFSRKGMRNVFAPVIVNSTLEDIKKQVEKRLPSQEERDQERYVFFYLSSFSVQSFEKT